MTATENINVIIADDHALFRQGFANIIQSYLQLTLQAEAADGNQVVSLVRTYQPDVILMDITMPGMNGIEATKIICNEYPLTNVIGLTMHDDEMAIVDMLNAGAKGYLSKNIDREYAIEAIETVHKGGTYYCRNTSIKLAKLIAAGRYKEGESIAPTFDENEIKVIKGICAQLSTKEIADQLCVSPRTIDGYRRRLLSKMQTKNVAGLVIEAVKMGIVKS